MKKLYFHRPVSRRFRVMTWLVWFRPVQEPAEEKKPEAEVPVHVGTINRATLRRYVTAYGKSNRNRRPARGWRLRCRAWLRTVNCVEGQRVEQRRALVPTGQPRGRRGGGFAEKSVERQQKLAKVEGTSQKALQDAEQALAAARTQQALLRIESPLAGVVTKVNARRGGG